MADDWGQNDKVVKPGEEWGVNDQLAHVSTAPPPVVPIGQQPATPMGVLRTMANQAGRAGGAFLENVNPVPMIRAVMSPEQTAKQMFGATTSAVGRTREAIGKHQFGEAAKSAVGAIPLIGPTAEQLVREASGGEVPEAIGHLGGIAALAALPKVLPKAINAIPSTERAGRNFQTVMSQAKNAPVDLSKASVPALRAQELREAGATMPTPINKFLQRTTSPGQPPLSFQQSRDFQSTLGRLSAAENSRLTPAMQAQVNGLAKALADANADAATKAGVGDLYQSALKEYRQAMKIRGAKETAGSVAKSVAGKVIAGAGLGVGGYAVGKTFGLWGH